jgi:hypothetical protein
MGRDLEKIVHIFKRERCVCVTQLRMGEEVGAGVEVVTAVPLVAGDENVVAVVILEGEESGGGGVVCCLHEFLCPAVCFTICALITVLLWGSHRDAAGG